MKIVTYFTDEMTHEETQLHIERKQEAQFERHVIDVMKTRYLAEFDAMPERDPRDETIEELQAKLLELEDANAALRDALSCAIEDDESDEPIFIAEDEPEPIIHQAIPARDDLLDFDAEPEPETDPEIDKLRAELEDGESLKTGKARLYAKLNNELSRLKNEEALLGKTIPRRAEVESLIGILARVGEA